MTSPRRWIAVSVGLALGALAACTGERPAPEEPSPSLPPAEQRLQFTWEEAVDVPASARAAVDMAREWEYALFLWDTDASVVPQYLVEHTGEDVLEQFRSISENPHPASGPVRVILIGVDVGESAGTLEICEDTRSRFLVDDYGRPLSDGSSTSGNRLELVRAADGRWIVDTNPWTREVQDRCNALLAGEPAPQPTPTQA